MDKKLYDLMDWAGVEAIVYSEEDHPEKYLGPHQTDDGITIQAFFPDAAKVSVQVKDTGEIYPMDMEDEAGFFAVLLFQKQIPQYSYLVTYEDETVEEKQDAYAFAHRRCLFCCMGAECDTSQHRRGFQLLGWAQASNETFR